MDETELKETLLAYLNDCSHLSLATQDQGIPHGASVFFVNIGFDLYFLSSPKSLHSRHIDQNPEVAATINKDYDSWLDIKGIQLSGRAECIGGILQNLKIAKAYVKKFPEVKDFLLSPEVLGPAIAQKVARVRFYRLSPARICFVNNAMGFGHREELVLEEGPDRAGDGGGHDR